MTALAIVPDEEKMLYSAMTIQPPPMKTHSKQVQFQPAGD